MKLTKTPISNCDHFAHAQGLIFRFKFMMAGTLLSAAITVIFFIISQVSEGHWKWGAEQTLQYTSAFFTGNAAQRRRPATLTASRSVQGNASGVAPNQFTPRPSVVVCTK